MKAIIRMIKKHYALILLIAGLVYFMKYKKECLCKPVGDSKDVTEEEFDINIDTNSDNFDMA